MRDEDQAQLSARVYLTEAWIRRHSPVNRAFVKTLRRWARNARRRAIEPAQMDLFA